MIVARVRGDRAAQPEETRRDGTRCTLQVKTLWQKGAYARASPRPPRTLNWRRLGCETTVTFAARLAAPPRRVPSLSKATLPMKGHAPDQEPRRWYAQTARTGVALPLREELQAHALASPMWEEKGASSMRM